MRKLNVLVVGQCPPPVHGQAVMIQALLQAPMHHVRLYHVPMVFSRHLEQVGRFAPGKLLQLGMLIGRIAWARLRHAATVLYYPPAGPNRIPMYRDWAVLLATRWMFRRTVFHFHAGGLTELLPRLSRPARAIFRLAYGAPDTAIELSTAGPQDGRRLGARRSVVIPYGVEDLYPRYAAIRQQRRSDSPGILFAGTLRASKGVGVLMEACRRLKAEGLAFRLELMGEFQTPQFENEIRHFVAEHHLQPHIRFLGGCDGPAKWEAYARADMFCFPSFYESENLPVVLIEAMQFALPIVATRWRGIPALVADGGNGLLVDTHSPEQVAASLARLLGDPATRAKMGHRGRRRYLREFTRDHWARQMEQVFIDLEAAPAPAPVPATGC